MITMTIVSVLALSIGLRLVGLAFRVFGGVMRMVFGLLGIVFVPIVIMLATVRGLAVLLVPALALLFVLGVLVPPQA